MLFLRTLVVAVAALIAVPATAIELEQLEGIYVGITEDFDGDGHKLAERHVDMVLTKHGAKGFKIDLTSVVLVDGRRDVPGVRRRVYSAQFEPSEKGDFFLATSPFDPFVERESEEMIAGEPLEWAQIDGDSLVIYTLAVLNDGRYELQVYERAFNGDTIKTLYERHLDGVLQRQTVGQMVRSD